MWKRGCYCSNITFSAINLSVPEYLLHNINLWFRCNRKVCENWEVRSKLPFVLRSAISPQLQVRGEKNIASVWKISNFNWSSIHTESESVCVFVATSTRLCCCESSGKIYFVCLYVIEILFDANNFSRLSQTLSAGGSIWLTRLLAGGGWYSKWRRLAAASGSRWQ